MSIPGAPRPEIPVNPSETQPSTEGNIGVGEAIENKPSTQAEEKTSEEQLPEEPLTFVEPSLETSTETPVESEETTIDSGQAQQQIEKAYSSAAPESVLEASKLTEEIGEAQRT